MGTLVSYDLADRVATIALDDGKANVLSPAMQAEVNAAIDQAAADGAAIVLTGREGRFSAGFDLAVLQGGGEAALGMFRGGFEISHRLLSYPSPVVMACTGHAVAMGAFLLLSGDYAVGAKGAFKIQANEVAIGITMPLAAVAVCRNRLTPAAFQRAVVTAEVFDPEGAVAAGFLDQAVDPAEVRDAARDAAQRLNALDRAAFTNTKLRARERFLADLQQGIEDDDAALRAFFG